MSCPHCNEAPICPWCHSGKNINLATVYDFEAGLEEGKKKIAAQKDLIRRLVETGSKLSKKLRLDIERMPTLERHEKVLNEASAYLSEK